MIRCCLVLILWLATKAYAQSIAFTFDDPHTRPSPLCTPAQRNAMILQALDQHQLKAILFVCGHRVNNSEGAKLLESWDQQGHLIANHSWSHFYFNGKTCSLNSFKNDFLRNDSLIHSYTHYTRLFRFPYLKEGNTLEKREGMRQALDSTGYRNGYVSVDASDWYIDGEMSRALEKDSLADLSAYRDFYLQHIYDRALYYDSLSTTLCGRKIKHVLLLHHNLLNALFLGDLLKMFETKGWTLVPAAEAYKDPVYLEKPGILPAGESIVWALAKQSGRYEKVLRYPAEDSEYEKQKLEKFLRDYKK